jgi:hypothetical protein
MTTLSTLDLLTVTGGGAESRTTEAGEFWHGKTRDHVSGDNVVSGTREAGSFWSSGRTREVDEDGRPYATGPSWHGR